MTSAPQVVGSTLTAIETSGGGDVTYRFTPNRAPEWTVGGLIPPEPGEAPYAGHYPPHDRESSTLRPHEWRHDPTAASNYRCRVCGGLFIGMQDACPGGDGSLAPDFEDRLRVLHDDAWRLSLDLRGARGAALGLKKTTLRAVGAMVETAAVELGRAVERASK